MRAYRIVCGCFALAALAASGALSAAEPARMSAYRADGKTSFALSLAAEAPAGDVDAVDVVVLFDTSASQQGPYRDAALAALESMLGELRAGDRVQIMALDLDPVPMMDDFAAANDPAAAAAIESLRRRAPLGSTNLEGGLEAAVTRLEQAGAATRSIVYIGDGASVANMLDAATLRPLVDRLRAARTPVCSFAIGPELDAQSLAVLANHSGGNLYVAEPPVYEDELTGVTAARAAEENQRAAAAVGEHLAAWTRSVVLWPTAVEIPGELGQVYPSPVPPLRGDRDSVLVGQTTAETIGSLAIRMTLARADGTTVDLSWNVVADEPSQDNAYLAELAGTAALNGGLTLPTVGTAGLAEAARLAGARADQLTMLAERAVAAGDRDTAGRIVQAVLRSDPGNMPARTVQAVVESDDPFGATPEPIETGPETDAAAVDAPATTPAPVTEGDIVLQGPPAAAPAIDVGASGSFLDEVEQERRVFVEMLAKEISNTIISARERMATDPQAVIQELKLALENLRKTPDVDSARRAELEDKLKIALREALRKASIKDELDRLREEELAAAREQKFLNERLSRRIEREKQLMDRFDALMDERKYVEAEDVAEIVEEVDPSGVTPLMATLWARHQRHLYLQMAARSARHAAAWDTMYQIELSHIPFPDNPPIVYPEASVWEELSKRRKARYAAVDLKSQGEAEAKIYAALREPLRSPLDFIDTPLNSIMQIIAEEYEIPIQFDNAALEAAALSADTEVTINLRNVTLRSAMELMLKNVEDLTYVVDNEVLMITTEEEAATRLQVKVYPVADLVLPIQNLLGGALGGGGGGLGGGGGGLGGGGGGFGGGGGGFGGGGGGFGGGGGGGFGGGGGGGGFFAVPDRIDADNAATPEKTSDEPTATLESMDPSTAAAPQVRGIEIDAARSPEAFWSQYFSGQQRDAAEVRRAVRDLMKQKQYDHVIALVDAALRNGQPQPWMYESLGIAMELGGRPAEDVERAIMSACDFSTSPDELMLIARYLSHRGLDRRAVEVYRQVIKAAPLYQEAYALALQAAQRAKDIEGLRWATVGVLRQAWPENEEGVRNTALRIAKATLDELKANGDQAAFEAYQEQLNAALIRDCVVKVTWSGEADVDLLVDEPLGTTCSLQEPRTAGGGVWLGDSSAGGDQPTAEGYTETYVCPEGFTGEYRVRIRKVWGDLVAGRVTVDVYKNFRSQDEQHERRHIAVGDDDAAVLFTLDNGRRGEQIEAGQLMAAIDRQTAVNRAILGQQIGALGNAGLIPDRSNLDPVNLRRALAFARGGGQVGFQPVITVLPDGTTMQATAVVSADRRYVRITVAPTFSGIGNVTTFTFAGAGQPVDNGNDTGNDNGNDGGGGGGDGGGGGGDGGNGGGGGGNGNN